MQRYTALGPDDAVLALETSCDETAAAVVRGGREIISNIVASQIDAHQRFGGVVPEVASRQHVLALPTVVQQALAALPGGWERVRAVAATYGPGLSGALLAGLSAGKAIAWGRELPFVGVNHLEAHIYANWLIPPGPETPAAPEFPLVALIISGGHTLLVLMHGHGRYTLLGQTRDDAAGEAFDKVARILNLGYPGGPAVERAAQGAPPGPALPRAWLRDSYDFSFSGLKTAVLHRVQERGQLSATATAQLASAFQESVVDVLVTKTIDAARVHGASCILLAGGVAANGRLRAEFTRRASVPLRYPPLNLCTDNAAMVAAAAFYRSGVSGPGDVALDVQPNLRLQNWE